MAKALTLNFEHTKTGMLVWFLDNLGNWQPLELVRYTGPMTDLGQEELSYLNGLRACRPDMGIHVQQYRVAA